MRLFLLPFSTRYILLTLALAGTTGLAALARSHHFMQRAAPDRVVTLAELYRQLEPGELLDGTNDPRFKDAWALARADSFAPSDAAPQLRPCLAAE